MPSKSRLLSSTVNKPSSLIGASLSNPSEVNLQALETAAVKYTASSQLPSTGNIGEQAFVEETNRLYIWNGSGWYNIALINTTPTWDSNGQPNGTYELDSNQNPTVITLAASDPDGLDINYSYVTSGQMDSMATISQDSSIFTITPVIQDSFNASQDFTGSITFRASDGVNILPQVSSFTLSFSSAPTFQSSNYNQINFTTTTGNAVSGKSQIDINYDGTAFLVGDHQLNQAKLYKKNGASWNLDHTFTNINSRNNFGHSIAMSDDTTKVVIGSNGSDSIDIFEWNGSSWQNYSITGPSNSSYGQAVSMSSDGTMIITGANGGDTFGSNSGEIYYIDKSSGSWINRQVIGNGSTTNLFFGDDCEISEDGKYIIGSKNAVGGGALFYNSGTQSSPNFTKVATLTSRSGIALSNDGSKNVAYRKIIDGSANTLYDIPVPSQDTSGYFGWDAAISDDGTVVVMGSRGYNSYQGAVIIFYDNDGTWESLNPIQLSTVTQLGTQVAISGNGKTFASMGRDSANRWRLYVFES